MNLFQIIMTIRWEYNYIDIAIGFTFLLTNLVTIYPRLWAINQQENKTSKSSIKELKSQYFSKVLKGYQISIALFKLIIVAVYLFVVKKKHES